MQENRKKEDQKNTTVSQKKDGQQTSPAKWKSKLFGIIILLIAGFLTNFFAGDSGKETGQNNYPTPGISITPELTKELQATPKISGELAKKEQQETKDDPSNKDNSSAKEPNKESEKDNSSAKEPNKESGESKEETKDEESSDQQDEVEILYEFRRVSYLEQHFEKHGNEFEYATKEEYLAGANRVIQSPDALHKIEAEDGDDIYYLEETNEFVVVSTDGYIRTYFRPSAGIAYYNRQ